MDPLLCVPDCCYSVCLVLDFLCGPPLVCSWLLLQCLCDFGSPQWNSSSVRLTATTVSAFFWISSVSPRLYEPGCCYSAYVTLGLLGGPPLASVCSTATTVSPWLWVSSVNLLLRVADYYYSVRLALDLLGEPPLVCS